MSKITKIWLIIAAFLAILGLLICLVALAASQGDLRLLETEKYITTVHEPGEFSNISIHTDTADILLVPSEDGICRVTCYEQEKAKHSVSVMSDTLTIETVDTRKWYDYISISFESPKITISLPQSQYQSLTIEESTGEISVSEEFHFESINIATDTGDVSCDASVTGSVKIATSTGSIAMAATYVGALDLSASTGNITATDVTCNGNVTVRVSTGKTTLENVTCQSLISSGSTGDISLKNTIAKETFSIERSTGDVRFEGSDAAEIFVATDTGDIEGSLLSEKVFIVDTDTGRTEVPHTTTGGKCEITTDTGDIKITLLR